MDYINFLSLLLSLFNTKTFAENNNSNNTINKLFKNYLGTFQSNPRKQIEKLYETANQPATIPGNVDWWVDYITPENQWDFVWHYFNPKHRQFDSRALAYTPENQRELLAYLSSKYSPSYYKREILYPEWGKIAPPPREYPEHIDSNSWMDDKTGKPVYTQWYSMPKNPQTQNIIRQQYQELNDRLMRQSPTYEYPALSETKRRIINTPQNIQDKRALLDEFLANILV